MKSWKKVAQSLGIGGKAERREMSEEELKKIMKPMEDLLYELFVADPKKKSVKKEDDGGGK